MNGGRRMDGIGDNYRIYYQINGSVTAVFIVLIQCYFLFSSRFGLDGFLGALLHTNDELLIGLAAILLDLAMTSGIYLVLKWGYEAWYQRRWIKDHPNLWLRGTWMHIHKKANGVVRTGVVEVKQNYMHIEVRARNYPFPAQGENLVTANQTEWQYYTSVITSDVLGMPDLVGCYIAEKQLSWSTNRGVHVLNIHATDQEGFPVVLKGHFEDTVGVGQSSDDKRGTLMWFKVDDALRSALFEGCTLDPNRLGPELLYDEQLSGEMYVRCLKDALQLNP
ncbi:MAG: hypothetical protein PUD02_04955 [Eggerthellales bacterium]|nr:hypothetical protein [Eggerthellales bacterium]